MDILWDAGEPMAVRDVLPRLGRAKLAYTTVMTTMDRLHKKHLLSRTKDGNAFVYRPAMTRDEYQARVLAAAIGPLLEQAAKPILSAFVDVAARADAKHLAELERLIAAHRRKR